MSPTELAAHEWLRRQGYGADQIVYQHSRSPDFLTSDGRGWEVKRAFYSSVSFGARQVCDLRQPGTTTVLFWRDGETTPFVEAPFSDLPMPGLWQGIRLHVNWAPAHHMPVVLRTTEAVDDVVRRYLAAGLRRKSLPLHEPVAA